MSIIMLNNEPTKRTLKKLLGKSKELNSSSIRNIKFSQVKLKPLIIQTKPLVYSSHINIYNVLIGYPLI